MESVMRPVEEVAPIIKKIYADEIEPKLGKIVRVSEDDYNYRVIIEGKNNVKMVTEVRRKDVDDYFKGHTKQSAKENIIKALNSFK